MRLWKFCVWNYCWLPPSFKWLLVGPQFGFHRTVVGSGGGGKWQLPGVILGHRHCMGGETYFSPPPYCSPVQTMDPWASYLKGGKGAGNTYSTSSILHYSSFVELKVVWIPGRPTIQTVTQTCLSSARLVCVICFRTISLRPPRRRNVIGLGVQENTLLTLLLWMWWSHECHQAASFEGRLFHPHYFLDPIRARPGSLFPPSFIPCSQLSPLQPATELVRLFPLFHPLPIHAHPTMQHQVPGCSHLSGPMASCYAAVY